MFKRFTVTGIVCAVLVLGAREVEAQGRDSVLNGAVIGAVVGAGAGVAFTHAVRDSDLVFSQCARGAIIFGAIGAGIGLGVDAMFSRMSPRPGAPPRRVSVSPTVWRDVKRLVLQWRCSGSHFAMMMGVQDGRLRECDDDDA